MVSPKNDGEAGAMGRFGQSWDTDKFDAIPSPSGIEGRATYNNPTNTMPLNRKVNNNYRDIKSFGVKEGGKTMGQNVFNEKQKQKITEIGTRSNGYKTGGQKDSLNNSKGEFFDPFNDGNFRSSDVGNVTAQKAMVGKNTSSAGFGADSS